MQPCVCVFSVLLLHKFAFLTLLKLKRIFQIFLTNICFFLTANASCENIRCRKGKRCLIDTNGGPPRCVTCPNQCQIPRTEPLCATNNYTYATWCHMMQDACKHGVLLEAKHEGPCQGILSYFISFRISKLN